MLIRRNRGRTWLDWQRRGRAIATAGAVIACTFLLGSLIFGTMGLPRYLAMRNHLSQLEQEIRALEQVNAALRADIERVQRDPLRLEELARERLGYVRKGETVFQFVPDDPVSLSPRGKQ
jgi:cell division protein FtsB